MTSPNDCHSKIFFVIESSVINDVGHTLLTLGCLIPFVKSKRLFPNPNPNSIMDPNLNELLFYHLKFSQKFNTRLNKKAMNCSVALIVQIVSIIAAIFGIIAAFIGMFTGTVTFVGIVRGIYTIIFCVFLILCEIYIFSFFKYFGFMFKNWGKALAYLFMGAMLFSSHGFGLACAIIFWILTIAYFVLAFIIKKVSPPLLQGGAKAGSPPSLEINSTEVYETSQKQMNQMGTIGKNNNGSNNQSPPPDANNQSTEI